MEQEKKSNAEKIKQKDADHKKEIEKLKKEPAAAASKDSVPKKEHDK